MVQVVPLGVEGKEGIRVVVGSFLTNIKNKWTKLKYSTLDADS